MTRKTAHFSALLMGITILIVAIFAAACGSEPVETSEVSQTATASGSATSEDQTTIVSGQGVQTSGGGMAWNGTFDGELAIGAINTLTGSGAMGGAEELWAQKKAVADQNAKGGVVVGGKHLEIKLVVVDDKSEPTEAAAAMEKLIKAEKVKLVLGSQVTTIDMAAASVAEKYGVFHMMCVGFTDMIREQHFKWSADIFNTPAQQLEVPFQIIGLEPQSERPTTWGLFMEDNQDGQREGDGAKAMAEKHGVPIAVYESYTPGAKDYSSSILKFKSAGVDSVIGHFAPADAITFAKQMKEQNYSPKLVMGYKGFWPQQFMEALGSDSNYFLHDGFWSEDLGTPYAKELGQVYRDEHNGLDSVSIGLFYAAAQVMFEAINRANSAEPAAVRDEVFGGTFNGTAVGDLTFDEDGIATIPHLGLQWMDGKRIIIWPDKGNELQWFVPWDER